MSGFLDDVARSCWQPDYWQTNSLRVSAKLIAFVSLLLWVGVVLAGRWIGHLS